MDCLETYLSMELNFILNYIIIFFSWVVKRELYRRDTVYDNVGK